ncbi:hypothetical protein A3D23_06625 [candidate division WOR-1 bacterium RIFCSPHIGHO2_02_FULL_53_26]|nr:MAG: hypothetical protein A3D23_06625 [candidate division WOR-1 bacterium RIFCSPHIGHO2_02_FULL_53_26]
MTVGGVGPVLLAAVDPVEVQKYRILMQIGTLHVQAGNLVKNYDDKAEQKKAITENYDQIDKIFNELKNDFDKTNIKAFKAKLSEVKDLAIKLKELLLEESRPLAPSASQPATASVGSATPLSAPTEATSVTDSTTMPAVITAASFGLGLFDVAEPEDLQLKKITMLGAENTPTSNELLRRVAMEKGFLAKDLSPAVRLAAAEALAANKYEDAGFWLELAEQNVGDATANALTIALMIMDVALTRLTELIKAGNKNIDAVALLVEIKYKGLESPAITAFILVVSAAASNPPTDAAAAVSAPTAAAPRPATDAAAAVSAPTAAPAVADKVAADKVAADKVAADKVAADKVAADKVAADKAAADKVAADKVAADKVAADKVAADKVAADKAAADKVAADKVAADKVAADKVAADKVAADKVAADKVAAEPNPDDKTPQGGAKSE